MNHLETLISEYYDWKGYLIKRNLRVGKLAAGGWEMELDVIAFNPLDQHLVHIESSTDAHSWEVREKRFSKKFTAGEKYIFDSVFPWLDHKISIEKIVVLPSHPLGRDYLCGAKIFSIDEMMFLIKTEVTKVGKISKSAIPEQYPLLRTIQLLVNGYVNRK
ncbi:hypothetical protein BEN71_04590 [Acinetobacter wuhouensis]|uniref:hypothetical protein n=1 Tax=Acinetobacter wuhouensis TaxID=1879050 RepID=UPI00083B5C60|nr:hypothetical protein [Acinetobacter wuhouensis]AXQ21404.1 hypothetical protein BEN71_04590 [Acinetobacter wuhouensis]